MVPVCCKCAQVRLLKCAILIDEAADADAADTTHTQKRGQRLGRQRRSLCQGCSRREKDELARRREDAHVQVWSLKFRLTASSPMGMTQHIKRQTRVKTARKR